MTRSVAAAGDMAPETPELAAIHRKVAWRILPLLALCYLVAYIDRVNISFAKLQMAQQLGLSDVAYGFGAGIFFIGYFLFEVPSNLALHRVGARTWFARIMISWAIVSACTAALAPIHQHFGPDVARYSFYAIRFLLGAAEAGFFPGVLLYLSLWFPASRCTLATGYFLLAQPIAFVIGGPVSGLILASFGGGSTMAPWQWMYIIEAMPAVVLGLVLFFSLSDRIEDARWLDDPEKSMLIGSIGAGRSPAATASARALWGSAQVWRLALIYFLLVLGAYGLNFWLPSIVKSTGVKGELQVGLLTAVPYAIGAVVMLQLARRAHRGAQSRRWAGLSCAGAGSALPAVR